MSAILRALERMEVDEDAWVFQDDDCDSFEPANCEDFDGFAYSDGSWSYARLDGDRFDDTGETPNIRTAKIAVQQAHFAHAIRTCNAARHRRGP